MLSAGSLQSPQILQLSGVGPADVLNKVGVPVLLDLPGVGQNLQDHYQMRLVLEMNQKISLNDKVRNPLSVMMMGLECGHLFCTSCWVEYLTTKIMDEGISQSIESPGNCEILVDDQTVMKLVKESKVRLKYQHLITNSFVQV